jgi:hypothetical protein
MPIRSLTRPLAVVALITAGQLCIAPTARAQDQLPEARAPVVADIPDHKLNAAATALMLVTRVQQEYEEQQQRMAEDANRAAEKAVTDQGLSVDEFKTIIVTAQNDPDVRKKILQRMPKTD